MTKTRIKLEFKPEDLWIGAFWKRMYVLADPLVPSDGRGFVYSSGYSQLDVWICLLPCLPIHITREYR